MGFTALGRAVATTNALRFHGHEPHHHDEPHLVYVVMGTARLTVEGRTILLRDRQGAWIPTRAVHAVTLSEDGIVLGPMLPAHAEPPGGQVRIVGPVRSLSELMTVVLCAAPETDAERVPFRDAIAGVLRETTREHFPLVLPTHPIANAVALEAPRFEGTLQELAERHFTSARHLQRLFVEETSIPFARWRTRARLNIAIVTLRAGEGLRSAMLESGFATRQGLLKAISRECAIPMEALLSSPDGPLAVLDDAA